jgi:hypothetical protein
MVEVRSQALVRVPEDIKFVKFHPFLDSNGVSTQITITMVPLDGSPPFRLGSKIDPNGPNGVQRQFCLLSFLQQGDRSYLASCGYSQMSLTWCCKMSCRVINYPVTALCQCKNCRYQYYISLQCARCTSLPLVDVDDPYYFNPNRSSRQLRMTVSFLRICRIRSQGCLGVRSVAGWCEMIFEATRPSRMFSTGYLLSQSSLTTLRPSTWLSI